MLFMRPELLLIAAPFIGSFLGVVIDRLPLARPIVASRSACDACAHPLGWWDLIPVASWVALRARCRYCSARLSGFYPAIELAALLIAAWSAAVLPGWLAWASCALGWTLLALAIIDLRWFVLPNELTLPLGVVGLAVAWLNDPATFQDHAVGAALGPIALLALQEAYRLFRGRDGLGTGDAILLGAIGAWVGWQGIATTLIFAAVGGLGFATLQMARGGRVALDSRIAFGPHLCLGAWLVWLYGPLQFS